MVATPVQRPRGSRPQLACLDEETILDRIEHRLDGVRAERVEQHLASCAACRKLVSEAVRGDYVTPPDDLANAQTLQHVDSDRDTGRHTPRDQALARGTVIDRYIVVALLGRGGMGVVYRAYDPDLNREVALKLVGLGELETAARDQARLRLVREAQALAKLSHPNVVTVHDVGRHGDDIFIAMELVDGGTLRAWLGESPRAPGEILAAFAAAAEGLAAAHAVGVVHRDFKPDNVMIGKDGRVRVVDFGLARLAPRGRASRPSLPLLVSPGSMPTSNELTHAGAMLGTPAYMSPEQDAGAEAGAPSDQFSFCVALYGALYGKEPFRGETYPELMRARATGDVASPPAIRGVATRVRKALLVGLRPVPEQRHAAMAALIHALQPRRWTSPRRVAIAMVAVLVLGGGSAWLLGRTTAKAEDPCAAAGDEIARTWNPHRRDVLIESFTTGHPERAAAATRIGATLDRWTADWSAARHALCERTHVTRSDPWDEPKGAEQLQCLQRRATELDANLTMLTNFDDAVITHAADAFSHLRPVSDCGRLAAQPVSEHDKAMAMPVMHEVLRARFAQNAARLDEAVAIAKSAVATARALQSPALAIALSCLGDAQAANGENDNARTTYRAAAVAATEIHEEGMVADAWMSTIQLTFRDRKIDDKLDDALFSAQLAVTRLPEDDARKPMFHYTAGSIAVLRGQLATGITELEQAIAGWTQIGNQAGQIASAQNSLGMAYADLGEWDKAKAALGHAADGFRAYGPDTPQLGTVLDNLGMIELYQEHYAASEPYMDQARAIYAKLRANHPLVGEGAFNLASLHVEAGHCDRALPLLATSRKVLTDALGAGSPMLAMQTLEEARCERDPKVAVALLEQAQQLATAHPVVTRGLPEIDWALAQALDHAGGDRARATRLAREARAAFVAIGAGTAPRVHAIDRWVQRR